VNPDAPVISNATLQSRTANGFQMVVEGFSTPREVTETVFTFTPASGGKVNFTLPAGLFGNEFVGWFANACSVDENMGSQFRLETNFTLQGSLDAVGTVSVKLRNRFGESNTKCVRFSDSTPCP
jgi:hypothetical protein